MSNTILQRFLDAGLFNFGDNDERLKDFQAAADDLAKDFLESPHKIISATLVAIDPAVPDDDPVLEETEASIKQHWNAFRNKFPERPKGFLRPVLLDAISQAAAKDANIASAVWLCGNDLLPWLEVGKERPIVEEFLREQGLKSEVEAEKVWAPSQPTEFASPKVSLKIDQPETTSVDAKVIKQALANYSHTYFTTEIGNAIADSVAKSVNKALTSLSAVPASLVDQIEPPLKKFGKELGASVALWVNAVVNSAAQRSDLLWWKESLYSPLLERSYRGLSAAELAVAMAMDLHIIAPAPSPQSVEYFLRETIFAVLPNNPEIALSDIIMAANQSQILARVVKATEQPPKSQRVSLSTTLQFSRQSRIADAAIPSWLGVRGDLKLPVAELAVWLFRDAQAAFLLQPAEEK